MDKTAIRNFAIEARKLLMKSAITEAGFYGITKDGCKTPIQKGNDFEVYETLTGTENRIYGDDIKRRANLVKAIEEQGFDQVIEETAYTWFNRIIAIRFMEVNNYLPTRVRVLSSETGSGTPDIITQADTVELNLSAEELDKIQNAKRENKYDEAFRILFVKQCNELNEILPGLFEKTNDYMELLLKITYTGDGVVRMLIDTIPEDNFNIETEGQVEIIGWMYQYYNTELKDDTFAKLKKNVKITKERIPAATQLFTPDWIVRYMVENSLGRIWIEHLRAVDLSVDEKAKADEFGWKYYLPEAEQEEAVAAQLVDIRKEYRDLTPQDITCIDPCMGSGHILVYMFDVLMDIYRSEGFSEREAVFDILEKNIRGLDIDRRAYQLSYFALMMKARGYNRIFFRGRENIDGERVQVVPQVYAIEESNNVNRNQLKYFGEGLSEIEKNDAINQMLGLLDQFINAKEYGSILNIDSYNWNLLKKYVSGYSISGQMDLGMIGIEKSKQQLWQLVWQAQVIQEKYLVVVTNPPYMSNKGMGNKLIEYVQMNYVNEKMDLFAVMMTKCRMMTRNSGFWAMITQHSWMFLSIYEKLRNNLYNYSLTNMLHLGTRTFEELSGEVVQSTAFVFNKINISAYRSIYMRLVEYDSSDKKESMLLKCDAPMYVCNRTKLLQIPTIPEIYWFSDKIIDLFSEAKLEEYSISDGQNVTGDNGRFVRMHWEIDRNKISTNGKWKLYAKGGSYRKWYGNLWEVVDWSSEAIEFYHKNSSSRVIPEYLWNKSGITWSLITTNNPSFRLLPEGCTFDKGGSSIFMQDDSLLYYALGILNSKLFLYIVNALNPTLNFQVKDIRALPFIISDKEYINNIVEKLIAIEKRDWDSYETSFDFYLDPLVSISRKEGTGDLRRIVEKRISSVEKDREEALGFEIQLNKKIGEIYGIKDEIDMSVSMDDISIKTVRQSQLLDNLIVFSIGCMFNRYSLPEISDKNFWAEDNVIVISEERYLPNDCIDRFKIFVKEVFGERTYEENIQYICSVLGDGSERSLRVYFCKQLYKVICSIFSTNASGKKPIYWLFDSGKENGFKCLIYMHKYNENTIGIIRSDYLVPIQNAIENVLKNVEEIIYSSGGEVDKATATKKREKYIKQINELRLYYQAISHIALQHIQINTDDGVKTNYAKFQGIEISNEGQKKQKIDLLAPI